MVAKYVLLDMTKTIGIREYKLFSGLPDDLRKVLPEIENLEILE